MFARLFNGKNKQPTTSKPSSRSVANTTPDKTPKQNNAATQQPEKKFHQSNVIPSPQVRLEAKTHIDKWDALPDSQLKNYPVFISGNDPTFELKEHQIPQGQGNLALIGTSGLRSVEIAGELGFNNKRSYIPKIYLIDNSRQVKQFWQQLKAFFEKAEPANLNEAIEIFLKDLHALTYHGVCEHVSTYTKNLITKLGYDYARAIILTTTYIPQDWAHTKTFEKIKQDILAHAIPNVYVYASNIASFPDNVNNKDIILANIQMVNPKLSLHTDFVGETAQHAYICQNQDPENIKDLISSNLIDESTQMYVSGMRIYHATPATHHNILFADILNAAAIPKLLGKLTPYFMAGLLQTASIDAECASQSISPVYPRAIVGFKNKTREELNKMVVTLNQFLPALAVTTNLFKAELPKLHHGLSYIGINLSGLRKYVSMPRQSLPSAKDKYYQEEYPSYLKLVEVTKNLFSRYGMVTENSDCFEETICRMAKEYCDKTLHVPSELLNDIISTTSVFADSLDTSCTELQLTTPVQQAKYIEKYFNDHYPQSAFLENKQTFSTYKNCNLSILVIKNEVLLSQTFLNELEHGIHAIPSNAREKYWKEAKTINATTSDCLNAFKQCKTSIERCELIQNHNATQTLLNLIANAENETNLWQDVTTQVRTLKNLANFNDANSPMMFGTAGKHPLTELFRRLDNIINDIETIQRIEKQYLPTQVPTAPVFK